MEKDLEEQKLPTFDIETINWEIPIAVGFFDGFKYIEFIKENEYDDVIWKFLSYLQDNFIGGKVWAHCASKFDSKFILASLCKHKEIVSIEAGLMRLKWRKPNITFEDSFPSLPMSLDKAAKMFGVEGKEEWAHESTQNPWEMPDRLSTFKSYLKNDCILLSNSMYKLCELLGTTFGQMPSISLSTTAAKVFDKCFYSLRDIESNEEYEDFIRKAIFGQRNEVYKRYGENINLYDIHWMYTSCYDVPIPVGKMRWTKPNIDKGVIAEATVKVPKDWYIGPLPHRYKGVLTFPVGEFTDTWDLRELRFAAEHGVDVTIRRQLTCEEEPVMNEFGLFMQRLDDKTNPLANYWKMFGLSVCGKLGQSRWRDEVMHISSIKNLEGWTPIDSNEEYFSKKMYLDKKAPYIRPAVTMRIRSEARIRHLKMLIQAMQKGDIFYGDTDSIYTTAELPTGKGVGELANFGMAERGYFIRQKLYGLVQKGKLIQRSAGYSDLKLREEDFINLLNGQSLDIKLKGASFTSYRKTLSEREVRLLNNGRTITGDLGDSRIAEGNDTRPICLP